MDIQVKSDAFKDGEMIPQKYTCSGEDVSPPIAWDMEGDDVESFALLCEDPDAPTGTFTHWVVYDLPPNVHELPEGVPIKDTLPNGGMQGINSTHKSGYKGPCPPSGTHRYYFNVFALNKRLRLDPGAGKDELLEAMKGHILSEGYLMGKYSRQ